MSDGAEIEPRRRRLNAPRRAGGQRTRAINFVAGLLLLQALLMVLAGVLELYMGGEGGGAAQHTREQAGDVLMILLGSSLFVVALGLWRRRPWAWVGAMALQGISLAQGLVEYLRREPDFFSLAMATLVVLALNQSEVREAFGTTDA
jgi:hypothetical protein